MGAAAAVIIMKERQVVEAFERVGATSPERARPASEVNVDEFGIGWRRLRERAIVREASPGRYYLDVEVWQAHRRMRRRVALILVLIVLVALSVGVFATASRHQ